MIIAKAYILNIVNDIYSAPSDPHFDIICLLVKLNTVLPAAPKIYALASVESEPIG